MGQASSQAAGAEHSKAKPIGMLVAAVMDPAVAKVLNPLLTAAVPATRWGVLAFFVLRD